MADFQPETFLTSLGKIPISEDQKLTNDGLVKSLLKGQLKALAKHLEVPVKSAALKPVIFAAVVLALSDGELVSDTLLTSIEGEADSVAVINAKSEARQKEMEKELELEEQRLVTEKELAKQKFDADEIRFKETIDADEKIRISEAENAEKIRAHELENERLKQASEQLRIKSDHERQKLLDQAEIDLSRQKAAQIQAEMEMSKARHQQSMNSRVDQSDRSHYEARDRGFDVSRALRLVPIFSEDDLDSFFTNFEHNASTMGWPEDKLTILLTANLKGKASIAYSNMEPVDKISYCKVKAAILAAYEEVPESYRQRFRNLRKKDSETYIEFSRNKSRSFDKWIRSREITEYNQLRNLILVEEFKDNIPKNVKVHLDDLEVIDVDVCARKADEYNVTHKFSQGATSSQKDSYQQKQGNGQRFGQKGNGYQGQSRGQSQGQNQGQNQSRGQSQVPSKSGQNQSGGQSPDNLKYCTLHGNNRSHGSDQCRGLRTMNSLQPEKKHAMVQMLTSKSTKFKPSDKTSKVAPSEAMTLFVSRVETESQSLSLDTSSKSQSLDLGSSQKISGSEHLGTDLGTGVNQSQTGPAIQQTASSGQQSSPRSMDSGGFAKPRDTDSDDGARGQPCGTASDGIAHGQQSTLDMCSEGHKVGTPGLYETGYLDYSSQSDDSDTDYNGGVDHAWPNSTCASINTAHDEQDFEQFMSQAKLAPYRLGVDGQPVSTEATNMIAFRDTGSSVTLLRRGSMVLTPDSATGTHVLVAGLTGATLSLPVHRVQMESALLDKDGVNTVEVGITESLPLKKVDILIGNDLAANRVMGDPIMTENPHQNPSSEYLETEFGTCFPSCVITRSKTTSIAEPEPIHNEPVDCTFGLENTFLDNLYNKETPVIGQSRRNQSVVPSSEEGTKVRLGNLQRDDPSLRGLYEQVLDETEAGKVSNCFVERDGVLLKKWRCPLKTACTDHDSENAEYLVVVPSILRPYILELGHGNPTSAHLGTKKTKSRIQSDFWWPQIGNEISEYVKTCDVCQTVGNPNQTPKRVPLKPIAVLEEPFSELLIDIVGPLPKTSTGFSYILTILDTTTRYPEAIPLRSCTARAVCKALIQFFSKFGLPLRLRSDQGSHFTANVIKQVLGELNIEQIFGVAYRPQTQGAIERFHSTLKSTIKKYIFENEKDWSEGLPFLLFAVRSSVHDSLGYSPNELVFGHNVRGPLGLFKEQCLSEPKTTNILDYVVKMRERLDVAVRAARENLKETQSMMKDQYDTKFKVKDREFVEGDSVLALIPTPGNALQSSYTPCTVVRRLDSHNYLVSTPGRRKDTQRCHINMLKTFHIRKGAEVAPAAPVKVSLPVKSDHVDDFEITDQPIKLANSGVLQNLDQKLSHLSEEKREEISQVIRRSKALFPDAPGRARGIQHDVDVGESKPIKQHPYRVGPVKRDLIDKEIDYMLKHDIIEKTDECPSEWSSPVLLTPKPQGWRFVTDFRKVNQVTKTDCYPIPRIDSLIDDVSNAKYVSKFDLLKGYWQIPLTERAKEISAFCTHNGLYRYKVSPFGMKNSGCTFQRLMNRVVAKLKHTKVYVDDLIVHTDTWDEHVRAIQELFDTLIEYNLTVNLVKSDFAHTTVQYLGHEVGQGHILPIMANVQAILDFPVPENRKSVMRLIGMAGFYRKFCPNLSTVIAPLTDLVSPKKPFVWTQTCQIALDRIKRIMTSPPVLVAPNYEKEFILYCDASDVAIGASLMQRDDNGIEHPLSYFSKKLTSYQKNYATVEKEALALLLAVKHYDVYLSSSCHPVQVYTDHNPLTFVHRMKLDNQRLLRWSLTLQEYNLNISHVKGSENLVADALTRI